MDQQVISGVGNIYANDALWEAGIDPKRGANTLTALQYKELFESIVKVLNEGIEYGGATAADAKYIDLHGMGGHYQDHFRVYDKEGDLCQRDDGGIIHKFMMGGRGTYLCPKCQG
jgi:formamidopyrimidine-DNA glycosylase